MKTYGECRYSSTHSLTSALDGGELSIHILIYNYLPVFLYSIYSKTYTDNNMKILQKLQFTTQARVSSISTFFLQNELVMQRVSP
jgi:hypothetical protein